MQPIEIVPKYRLKLVRLIEAVSKQAVEWKGRSVEEGKEEGEDSFSALVKPIIKDIGEHLHGVVYKSDTFDTCLMNHEVTLLGEALDKVKTNVSRSSKDTSQNTVAKYTLRVYLATVSTVVDTLKSAGLHVGNVLIDLEKLEKKCHVEENRDLEQLVHSPKKSTDLEKKSDAFKKGFYERLNPLLMMTKLMMTKKTISRKKKAMLNKVFKTGRWEKKHGRKWVQDTEASRNEILRHDVPFIVATALEEQNRPEGIINQEQLVKICLNQLITKSGILAPVTLNLTNIGTMLALHKEPLPEALSDALCKVLDSLNQLFHRITATDEPQEEIPNLSFVVNAINQLPDKSMVKQWLIDVLGGKIALNLLCQCTDIETMTKIIRSEIIYQQEIDWVLDPQQIGSLDIWKMERQVVSNRLWDSQLDCFKEIFRTLVRQEDNGEELGPLFEENQVTVGKGGTPWALNPQVFKKGREPQQAVTQLFTDWLQAVSDECGTLDAEATIREQAELLTEAYFRLKSLTSKEREAFSAELLKKVHALPLLAITNQRVYRPCNVMILQLFPALWNEPFASQLGGVGHQRCIYNITRNGNNADCTISLTLTIKDAEWKIVPNEDRLVHDLIAEVRVHFTYQIGLKEMQAWINTYDPDNPEQLPFRLKLTVGKPTYFCEQSDKDKYRPLIKEILLEAKQKKRGQETGSETGSDILTFEDI